MTDTIAIDPMMKDILALQNAIDAIDGTSVGNLSEALDRIGDRAARIRHRRQCELEQISATAALPHSVASAERGA